MRAWMLVLVGCLNKRVPETPPPSQAEQLWSQRVAAIAELEARLEAETLPDGDRAETMLQLAGLWAAHAACAAQPGCAPDGTSIEWSAVVTQYEAVLLQHPEAPAAMEASFLLAEALRESGESEQAVSAYIAHIQRHPDSPYLADAYVQVGEYYFEQNEAYKALLAYHRASRYEDAAVYAYALHKMAWCYFNVGEYGKSADTMRRAIEADSPESPLLKEAQRGLVLFYASGNRFDEANAYIDEIDAPHLREYLASHFLEQGQYEEALLLYQELSDRTPGLEGAAYLGKVVYVYRRLGDRQATFDALLQYRERYGAAAADAMPAQDETLREAVSQELEELLSAFAVDNSRIGWHPPDRDTIVLAERAYDEYFLEFPDGPNDHEMRYTYAEMLYKLKRYDEAFVQYTALVERDPAGRHSEFCATSAFYAAEYMVRTDPGPEPAGPTEPAPLSTWEQRYLGALDRYAELYPEHLEKVSNVRYRAAYLHYTHNAFEEAIARFELLLQPGMRQREAEHAALLIVDVLMQQEAWEEALTATRRFLGLPFLQREVFRAKLAGVEAELEQRVGE